MASTTFVNGVTLSDADWFNDVNDVAYDVLGNGTNVPATKAEVRQNLPINDLTEDTNPSRTADYIETYDSSANTSKKVLLGRTAAQTLGGTGTLSGTAINITGIPSWVTEIKLVISALSTNGTSIAMVQIGDSGGIGNSGYSGATSSQSVAATGASNYSTGFHLGSTPSGSTTTYSTCFFTLIDAASNLWGFSTFGGYSNSAASLVGGGSKALSGTLDRFRITTVGGTDSYDSGTYAYYYS